MLLQSAKLLLKAYDSFIQWTSSEFISYARLQEHRGNNVMVLIY